MKYTTNFPTTVGIEYTFVPRMNLKHSVSRRWVGWYAAKALQMNEFFSAKTRAQIHGEDGAVEIPSPVHRNRKKLLAFGESLFYIANRENLAPCHTIKHKNGSETYLGTGGGHVHVGIPKGMTKQERELFLHNVAIDSFNRFEINWFFQEWHENEALPDWIKRPHELGRGTERIATAPIRTRLVPIAIRDKSSKHVKPKTRTADTLEFRLFDAPRDMSMVEKNVDFALSYTMYMKNLSKRGIKLRPRKREVLERAKLTPEQVRGKLKRLFSKLKLNYERDYHKTYFENYEMRREYGKL